MGRGRTLAEFQKEFPDEERCAAFFMHDAGHTVLFVPRAAGTRRGLEEPAAPVGMPRLRTADLAHRRHGDASVQIAADDVVLGGACDGDAFSRIRRTA